MQPVIKTTNPVTLNFAQAVLKDADIPSFLMDQHVSMIEGSIGAIPRRLMVADEDLAEAIHALELAELGDEVFRG